MPREPKTAIRLRKLTAWLAAEHGIRADIEHRQEGGHWQWWLIWYDGPPELPTIGAKAEELGVDISRLMSARVVTSTPPPPAADSGQDQSAPMEGGKIYRLDRRSGQPATGDIAGAMEALAGQIAAVGSGNLDAAAALSSLTAARRLATELERGELTLIEAARDDGATWAQIATAMGANNRQTAQKRHADLARRLERPPAMDAGL